MLQGIEEQDFPWNEVARECTYAGFDMRYDGTKVLDYLRHARCE